VGHLESLPPVRVWAEGQGPELDRGPERSATLVAKSQDLELAEICIVCKFEAMGHATSLSILLASGLLVQRGHLNLGEVIVFGILGAVSGDQIGYWIGRGGGRPFVLRWGGYVFITPARLGPAEALFARHGGSAVFLARFVAGLRVFGALVAGTSCMPWGKVTLYNVLGGTVWASAVVLFDYFLWAGISLVEHWVGRASLLLLAGLALALLLRWAYRRVMRG
jgi:membrane protein DedA with SNARE-associated domain